MDFTQTTEDDLPAQEGQAELAEDGYPYTTIDGKPGLLKRADFETVALGLVKQFKRCAAVRKNKIEPVWEETAKLLDPEFANKKQGQFNGVIPWARQTLNTLQAHIWSRSIATNKVLFSVDGKRPEAKEAAPIYKNALLEAFKHGRIQQQLDQAAEDFITKGVVVGYIGRMEKTRKLNVLSGNMGSEPKFSPSGELMFTDVEKKVCDTAVLKVLCLTDFVFDTENDDWDSCFKACIAPFKYEELAKKTIYSYTEELKDEAKNKLDGLSTGETQWGETEKKDDGYYPDGSIELMEIYGDIRLPSGDYLENWCAVVAARRYLIRFEPNPYYINPFVKLTYENSEHGWGKGGPIAQVANLIIAGSNLAQQAINYAQYEMNPAFMMPEGMLTAKTYNAMPGDVLTYKPLSTQPNVQPIPLRPSAAPAFPLLQLLEGQVEATTGATRQLSGNVTTNDKAQTATEFTGLQVIGNLQIDRIGTLFDLDFKLPAIEKMALMQAMFNPEEVEVEVEDEEGKKELKQMKPEMYYYDYEFAIGDSRSESERKQMVQEKIALLSQMIQDPELGSQANKQDLFKEVWRDLGYGKTADMFRTPEEQVFYTAKMAGIQILAQNIAQQFAVTLSNSPEFLQLTAELGAPQDGFEQQAAGPVEGELGGQPELYGAEGADSGVLLAGDGQVIPDEQLLPAVPGGDATGLG